MIEPVELQNFFITFFSAAMVVVLGAVYALMFALSRIHKLPKLMFIAYLSYIGLFGSTLLLSYATNLNGYWKIVVAVMLIGYLLAPHGIWYLCVGTHSNECTPISPQREH